MLDSMQAFRMFAKEATGMEAFDEQIFHDLEIGIWNHIDKEEAKKRKKKVRRGMA